MALILSGDTGVPASGMPTGSVIQVQQTTISSVFNTASTTYTHATNHSLSITTIAANSKILLSCNTPLQIDVGDRAQATFRSSIDSYAANLGQLVIVNEPESASGWMQSSTLQYLHSPAQAAGITITYRVYVRRGAGSNSIYYPDDWGLSDEFSFIAMEIKA